MPDSSNYYEAIRDSLAHSTPTRYPANHVRFSPLLAPLKWISLISKVSGKRAFTMEKGMLREFDKSTLLDRYIGDQKDLADMRRLLVSYCRGMDNNTHL